MYGSPLHRQQCMSPKSTSITRASPQCHDFRCNQRHGRSLEVRTSGAHSRCNRNRQPRASDAHPCTALCARRCRQTTQSESQTSCTLPLVLHQPMHTVRQQPARKEQQLATAVHTNAGGSVHNTAPRRSNDSRVHSSPNRTTAVRTTRACRRTSLCNSRAHSFAQLPEHRTGTSAQQEQELRHHGCTQCIAIARANVTTARSFFGDRGSQQGIVNR